MNGTVAESGNRSNPRKMCDKSLIMQYTGWILQCYVSGIVGILYLKQLEHSNRAVKNVLLTIPPGTDGL